MEKISDKVAKYLHHNINNHNNDIAQAGVITDFVTSQLGELDGCLTLLDFHIPLADLVCERLGKPGIPYSSAHVTNNTRLTLKALREQTTPMGAATEVSSYWRKWRRLLAW